MYVDSTPFRHSEGGKGGRICNESIDQTKGKLCKGGNKGTKNDPLRPLSLFRLILMGRNNFNYDKEEKEPFKNWNLVHVLG